MPKDKFRLEDRAVANNKDRHDMKGVHEAGIGQLKLALSVLGEANMRDQFFRDLNRTPVIIDGSPRALRPLTDELKKEFDRPEIYSLNQQMGAFLRIFLREVYQFAGRRGNPIVVDKGVEITLEKKGEVYSSTYVMPIYGLMVTPKGKEDNFYLFYEKDNHVRTVTEIDMTDRLGENETPQTYITQEGLRSIATARIKSTVDCSVSPPRTRIEVEVDSNAPQLQYVGPTTDPTVRMEIENIHTLPPAMKFAEEFKDIFEDLIDVQSVKFSFDQSTGAVRMSMPKGMEQEYNAFMKTFHTGAKKDTGHSPFVIEIPSSKATHETLVDMALKIGKLKGVSSRHSKTSASIAIPSPTHLQSPSSSSNSRSVSPTPPSPPSPFLSVFRRKTDRGTLSPTFSSAHSPRMVTSTTPVTDFAVYLRKLLSDSLNSADSAKMVLKKIHIAIGPDGKSITIEMDNDLEKEYRALIGALNHAHLINDDQVHKNKSNTRFRVEIPILKAAFDSDFLEEFKRNYLSNLGTGSSRPSRG